MIISRTPLRISFVGGGSDLINGGAVISTTIDKYMYVSVNQKFDGKLKVAYTKTEIVDRVDQLEHELAKECLRFLGIGGGLEISSICDIPAGTGLGSSSSYTVGLLNALHFYKGEKVFEEQLAEEASEIEINRCQRDIGRQDQYAAAFGGLNYIEFGEKVEVETLNVPDDLESGLLLFYVGSREEIPPRENKNLEELANCAKALRLDLMRGTLDRFGYFLDRNWGLKRENGVSNKRIDKLYDLGIAKGASGGKLLGAGGGGFMLFYAGDHDKLVAEIPLRKVPFAFENEGSKIIYEDCR